MNLKSNFLMLSVLLATNIVHATGNTCGNIFASTQNSIALSYDEYLKLKSTDLDRIEKADFSKFEDIVSNFYRTNYAGKSILIFADDEIDQSSGVATVMKILKGRIEKKTGLDVVFITPKMFRRQADIKFQGQTFHQALPSDAEILGFIEKYQPAAIHVMAELVVGNRARAVLIKNDIPFTTAYHTEWPKFTSIRLKDLPGYTLIKPTFERLVYWYLRKFHAPSKGVMVPSESLIKVLLDNDFKEKSLRPWSHGVDLELFHPEAPGERRDQSIYHKLAAEQGREVKGKILVMVSRLGTEKNAEDFFKMKLDVEATRFFVGPGSESEVSELKRKYPEVIFLGRRNHETEIPELNRAADLFVFTGYYETYGLVMGEALASGTPVLAYNVQGPKDIVTNPNAGVLVDFKMNDPSGNVKRLGENLTKALSLDRQEVRKFAETISWDGAVTEFISFLYPLKINP